MALMEGRVKRGELEIVVGEDTSRVLGIGSLLRVVTSKSLKSL